METRTEHLAWCQQRALEYVDAGGFTQAVTSMLSDLSKHPETADHVGIQLGMRLLMAGKLATDQAVRNWVTGFN